MISQYIEDQRVYITVGSDATEVECDLSHPYSHDEIPCLILEGPLMGYEIMLERSFIVIKALEEQGEDAWGT